MKIAARLPPMKTRACARARVACPSSLMSVTRGPLCQMSLFIRRLPQRSRGSISLRSRCRCQPIPAASAPLASPARPCTSSGAAIGGRRSGRLGRTSQTACPRYRIPLSSVPVSRREALASAPTPSQCSRALSARIGLSGTGTRCSCTFLTPHTRLPGIAALGVSQRSYKRPQTPCSSFMWTQQWLYSRIERA